LMQKDSAEVELINRETATVLTLPPIKHPSMHPKEKPFANAQEEIMHEKIMKREMRKIGKSSHKNAQSNLTALLSEYPAAQSGVNLKFVDTDLPDLMNKEKHLPGRLYKKDAA